MEKKKPDKIVRSQALAPVARTDESLVPVTPPSRAKLEFMPPTRFRLPVKAVAAPLFLAAALVLPAPSALAAAGETYQTPNVPQELPVEVEIELGQGSLKQAPLWKELIQFLTHPYGPDDLPLTADDNTIVRRPGFGVTMPPLNTWPMNYNFLTGQPLRLRTSDGEVSWDHPGPLFDPAETAENGFPVDAFNVPTQLRSVIGALIGSDNQTLSVGERNGSTPCTSCGFLIVSNPNTLLGPGGRSALGYAGDVADPRIPPDGTIVAVPAFNPANGRLRKWDPVAQAYEPINAVNELEIPINEEDFFRPSTDVAGVPIPRRPYIGRPAAEVLGKALFWDMQVGSDGVQSCGTCHFSAGVDNRTKNQLNPDSLGGGIALDNGKQPNSEVTASDFPFHKLANPDIPGEPLLNPGNNVSDSKNVMSSMGVKIRKFVDIPVIGPPSFGPASNPTYPGVKPLKPDLGDPLVDFPAFTAPDGSPLRRVEPRNTPTMHAAAFNFDNFWDGRARFHYNGGSVFGPSDPQAHIFIDPGDPNGGAAVNLQGANNGHIRPDLIDEEPEVAGQPVRIKFSSLASQAMGPPLSDFEMSFQGRNWAKIGKKLLQFNVTPLANQLVDPTDSVLGPFSNQRSTVGGAVDRPGRPGLNVSYEQLIQMAFTRQFWQNTDRRLLGRYTDGRSPAAPRGTTPDPFDGYVLTVQNAAADPNNRNHFRQVEANFSLFFGIGVQAYESLLIPDNTPFDRFMDANPLAANATGEPGSLGVLIPWLIPQLVTGSDSGTLNLIPDDPATPEFDGFGPDEVFGFDLFGGLNLTAALPRGSDRNPIVVTADGARAVGSNPFARSAKCMLCHLGPEQTDHSINISHGLLKGNSEYEFPTPSTVIDQYGNEQPAPEPTGPPAVVRGLILEEEIEFAASAQDAVEVEPRSFALLDDPATPWDDRIVAQPRFFAFGDQGIYNIGLRPSDEDIGRGGDDPWAWPLSLSALTLKNIGGAGYEPADYPTDSSVMTGFDPYDLDATFEETGDGAFFPGTTHTLQSINPGHERRPIVPQTPEHLAPWVNDLPAGELHPQIDEMAGLAPNTITPPNGGPGIEFTEYMFGDDLHCSTYNPAIFGSGPPSFGWGATDPQTGLLVPGKCPQNQSGVAGNMSYPTQGTWPVPNRVLRNGAFKAPGLRNVELTGPFFHTGSYLTLRQVVDFYMRGGDFPVTNLEERDPHIVDVGRQAFAFGTTIPTPENGLEQFADALPDTDYRYDAMPDTDHPITPEPAYLTSENVREAIVKYLLSLTDPRVRYEKAPFDRPELFVPVDGKAPDNTGGRTALLTDPTFRHLSAVGAAGRPDAVPSFLGISSTPVAGPNNDHFDR